MIHSIRIYVFILVGLFFISLSFIFLTFCIFIAFGVFLIIIFWGLRVVFTTLVIHDSLEVSVVFISLLYLPLR